MRTTVDLYQSDTCADGRPHERFSELRATRPGFWQDIPGQDGCRFGSTESADPPVWIRSNLNNAYQSILRRLA